ncbi:CbtA family protein [Streptomyces marispadix]|uniref:CbtA family protein n=1 Tax=Streptomyces marispadix TaxID=2922868 RepID=A0ABS9SUN4_9ACTN|nr:CbtA family protein [Streptomyces marispadix]MCH6159898.1 CbtA family protein [Streptomyces marispadix]
MNSATVRTLLVRGMLAGLVAGLFALVTASLLGEPHVDAAIAYEEAHAHSHEHGEEIVSRGMQSTAGLATAVLVYGVALGGIASLAFSFALGRVGRFGPRATALLLSGAAFVCVYLVPFLKYPANPPSVGDPASLDKRTALYFLMVLLSVLLAVAATILGKRLAPRLGNWYATVTAVLGFAFAVGLAYAFLPSLSELPEHFPALLLWRFRVSALAVQLVLWSAFGLAFGHLAERALGAGPLADGERGTAPPPAATAAN